MLESMVRMECGDRPAGGAARPARGARRYPRSSSPLRPDPSGARSHLCRNGAHTLPERAVRWCPRWRAAEHGPELVTSGTPRGIVGPCSLPRVSLDPPARRWLRAMRRLAAAPPICATVQEEAPDERALIKAAMATLRSRRVTEADRDEAIEALLELGAEGPRLPGPARCEGLQGRREGQRQAHRRGALRLRQGGRRGPEGPPRPQGARGDRRTPGGDPRGGARQGPHQGAHQVDLRPGPRSPPGAAHRATRAGLGARRGALRALGRVPRRTGHGGEVVPDLRARARGPGGRRAHARPRVSRLPLAPARDAEAASNSSELRAWLATPMGEADQRVFAANRELAGTIDDQELAGIFEHNRRRVLIGLGAQRIDVKLCDAGRGHSKDMEELGSSPTSHPSRERRPPDSARPSRGPRAAPRTSRWGCAPAATRSSAGGTAPGTTATCSAASPASASAGTGCTGPRCSVETVRAAQRSCRAT